MTLPEKLLYPEFAKKYCERQENTPDALAKTLREQRNCFPDVQGWFLAECQDLSSSRIGHLVILPYGPSNTHKTPPAGLFSPRGLASDTSIAVAILLERDLPRAVAQ